MLDPQFICNHRDKLGVGRFGFADVDGVAEQVADGVDVAAGPGYLDGVADGAFHAGRRRFEALGDSRIERFCNCPENFDIVVNHRNGFTQILISLNVGGNADFVDDAGDVGVKITAFVYRNNIGFGALHDGRRNECGDIG